MGLEDELSRYKPDKDTVLTIGVFDGVHLGHKHLISKVKERAKRDNLLSGVITFGKHPREVLSPSTKLPNLTDLEQRRQLLKNEGLDLVIVLPFESDIARLSARDFVILLKKYLGIRALVVGPDFALGKNREGDAAFLRTLGEEMGFDVTVVQPITINNEVVSSTAIRNAMTRGDMPKVRLFTGRLFSLHGPVIAGAGRGAKLGFPTANLAVRPEQCLPADGIYATWAYIDGKPFKSATSIGKRPTFNGTDRTVETYVIDYKGDLYGKEFKIEIVQKIRDEKKFENIDGLKTQMAEDVKTAIKILESGTITVKNGVYLDYLLKRGVAEIIVEQEMVALLKSGKKLRLKEGFDPSAPDIHLGHMVALRKLRQFQDMGHQVVLIVGDWTARIGDPTGVSLTRPMLTAEQVQANARTYMEQFFKIVDRARTEVRWQSEWFGKFSLTDVIQLTSKFTVAQLMAREDFSSRFAAGRSISLTELLYPLLQAYDSVAVKADVEFGGTDQKFNLLVGRELQRMMGFAPQQVFLVPLLVGTDGVHKMSKSLGNYIGVAESPDEIYGKVMSIPDNLILLYFELVTNVSNDEIEEFRQGFERGTINPMVVKKRLGREIVAQLYDWSAAVEAEEHFVRVFQKRELPEQIAEAKSGQLLEMIVELGMAKSRSDAKRLIVQGAVDVDGEKASNPAMIVPAGSSIKVGKRGFIKAT